MKGIVAKNSPIPSPQVKEKTGYASQFQENLIYTLPGLATEHQEQRKNSLDVPESILLP